MLLLLIALQLTLPLGLLFWLAAAPLESFLGRWLQRLATAIALLSIALAGIWVLPPWWAPYLFGAVWLRGTARVLMRDRAPRPFLPGTRMEWAGATTFLFLGLVAAFVSGDAWLGRTPSSELLELSPPLRGGPYFVVSGGSTASVNFHIRSPEPLRSRIGESYAVDLVKIDAFGLRAPGIRPVNPAAYHIFGEALYAPCDGLVLAAEDEHPDLSVPQTDREHTAGNHVVLDCGGAIVFMAHMRRHSVAVAAGDRVRTGTQVGAVGNSGNSSEPHLHIHAQEAGPAEAPLSGKPLQIRIDGKFLVRNDRVLYRSVPHARWRPSHRPGGD